jgi:hypothetical protein
VAVEESSAADGERPVLFVVVASAVVLLHLLLTFYFDPLPIFLANAPFSGLDFDTHIEQTWRVIEGLEGWGRSWVYDVKLLAGFPNGTIFDADNKGWELWTYALTWLGMHKGRAFSSFLLLAHLAVLPVFYGSSRLFGVGRWGALLAAALGSWIWFFDSFFHWMWFVGMVAYAFSAYLFLLPLALFFRWEQAGGAWRAALAALSLGGVLLVHPYSFFILVVPMAVMYLRAARARGPSAHLQVAGVVAFALGVNLYWLIPAFEHWHYILDSAYFGAAGVSFVFGDFFSLLLDTSTTGIIGNRTGFRFLALTAALVACVIWRRQRDPRFGVLGVGMLAMLAAAYLSSYVPAALQVQPYRFVAGAASLAVIGMGWLFDQALRSGAFRRLGRAGSILGLILFVPASQHLVRDVTYYFPYELPEVPHLLDGLPSMIGHTGYPPHQPYRHIPNGPELWILPNWLNVNARGGRVAVQNGGLGEQLAWRGRFEIIGGFTVLNLQHSHANIFRRLLEEPLTTAQIRKHLETYAISLMVMHFDDRRLDALPELFTFEGMIAGQRVYRTRVPISKFERGSGFLNARTNRIEVRKSVPSEPLVLRYHFHEKLRCSPDCRVERVPNPVGGVDLIGIPAPHPANLRVELVY